MKSRHKAKSLRRSDVENDGDRRVVLLRDKFIPKFWEHADQRLAVVREIRRRVDELIADSGAVSVQQRLLCERAAFIALRLESMEREAVEQERIDFGSYVQATNGLVGLLRTLGLERRVKTVVDLQAHLASRKERNGNGHG